MNRLRVIASGSGVVANIYLAERMASAEREPITGVWGQSPLRGPGAEPLVGVRGAKPPEAEKVLRFAHAMEQQTCLTTLCILETE